MTIIDDKRGVRCTGGFITLYQDLLKLRSMALTNDEVNAAWIMTSEAVTEKEIIEKYREALKAA